MCNRVKARQMTFVSWQKPTGSFYNKDILQLPAATWLELQHTVVHLNAKFVQLISLLLVTSAVLFLLGLSLKQSTVAHLHDCVTNLTF